MAINVPKEYEVPLYLFHQGKNAEAYKLFGSHFAEKDGVRGVVFRVWAPKAADVSVVGDFNHWNREESYMKKISDGGIWELFIPGLKKFDNYKYSIKTERGQIPTVIIWKHVQIPLQRCMIFPATTGKIQSGWTRRRRRTYTVLL